MEFELMDLIDWLDLPEGEQQVRMLKAGSSTDVKSRADLEQRVIDYVHMNCLDGAPVSMASLNRRFGRLVRAHGEPLLDFLAPLFRADVLRGKRVGAATLLYTPKYIEQLETELNTIHAYEKDAERRADIVGAALDTFWDRAR